MKIVHIQCSMGPAGNAAHRLHLAMISEGIQSSILNIYPSLKRNNVYSLRASKLSYLTKALNYFYFSIKLRGKKKDSYFYRILPVFGCGIKRHSLITSADVIYIHWVAGALSVSDFKGILQLGKPVIVFMHDMWPFTGGCHHSFDCKGYEKGCHNCPMFSNSNTPHGQIEQLYKLYSHHSNLVFVSPSRWMADCAKQSYALRNNKVFVIPNLVDENIFKPIDKIIAKQILNLPIDKFIITFGCQSGTNNKFKGWLYLKEAIEKLNRDNIHIVIYGSEENKDTVDQVKFPITFLGPILDETKLSLICNATDIFISPSLAESFGLTFLENILCGTPVIGFDNTAISEIVKTNINGYLARNRDALDLCHGIEKIIDKEISVTGRLNYSSKEILQKHKKLIEQFI